MTLSASKSLSDMAKNRLRLTPFYSDILPVGYILPGSYIKNRISEKSFGF